MNDKPTPPDEQASTGFRQAVHRTLSEAGELARHWPNYVPRAGQIDMAQAVAQSIEEGSSLVVQAGTGVGKTCAYLVPALLSQERTLISTATKALQEQLHGRDLPELLKALGLNLKVALLKGRSSYLCLHRLEQTLDHGRLSDRGDVIFLDQVKRWAGTTRQGDVAELAGLEDQSTLLPLITSTRDNCLGSECAHWQDCHVNLARKAAMQADVVVINHHLFFADWQVRASGVAELLPQVRVVVFDEAHQLNEVGTQFLGDAFTSSAALEFSRDGLMAGLQHARGVSAWQDLSAHLQQALKDWRLVMPVDPVANRYRWLEQSPDGVSVEAWAKAWQGVTDALEAWRTALEGVAPAHLELTRLLERCEALLATAQTFEQPVTQGVRWLETGSFGSMGLHQAPLDLQTAVADLWGPNAQALAQPDSDSEREAAPDPDSDAEAPPPPSRPRAWIFTSATLGVDEHMTWFTQPCGLTHARTLKVQSPFDYPSQGVLFVPSDMVEPRDPLHSEQVAVLATRLARALGGRTLVLTTTNRALKDIAAILSEDLDQAHDPEVMWQGQHTKRQLMSWFQQGGRDPERGAVLVATASFWEGFDVPGDALQAVIIDKLPFAPPNDPMMEARAKQLEAQGLSPFAHLHLPDVAVSLQQGAGRLIRTQTDQGVLVIADRRLVKASYGAKLMAGLPPMRRVHTAPALFEALREMGLTKSDTKAS